MPNADTSPTSFGYRSEDIKKYVLAAGLFTLMLQSGKIIHYEPEDAEAFERWLLHNGIQNIR